MLVALKQQVVTSLLGDSADGRVARKTLGRALHTVQDFFSHSSAIETGAGVPNFGETTLGRLPMNVATCTGTVLNPGTTLIPGAGLTSGYFQIPLCSPPAGKCRHGVDFICPTGLNKDSPGRTGYEAAHADALTATENFVNGILNDSRIAGNARAIKRLMDIRATLGAVIDAHQRHDNAQTPGRNRRTRRRSRRHTDGLERRPGLYRADTFCWELAS